VLGGAEQHRGSNRPVVIVVNDNGRSYAPTIGGLADHLAALQLQPNYEKFLEKGRDVVRGVPVIGELCYQCMHSVKAGLKDALQPQASSPTWA
jgi:1-deoxy-D-xylulose-5-phosphate synthase